VRTLLQSNVHTVVLSGDNELTSGAIAFGCGMLDSEDLLYCDLQVAGRGKKRIVVRSRDSLSENRDVIGSMGVYVPEDGVESN
jgi:magnesium-transporting ATPase (P-type)